MDLAKYRNIFLEEATDHLGEISTALLALEKSPDESESIDLLFRMVHSMKGMGASLGFDALAELSHHMEDRLGHCRSRGRVPPADHPLLFRGLETLESMVAEVRAGGDPSAAPDVIAAFREAPEPFDEEPAPKKALRRFALR